MQVGRSSSTVSQRTLHSQAGYVCGNLLRVCVAFDLEMRSCCRRWQVIRVAPDEKRAVLEVVKDHLCNHGSAETKVSEVLAVFALPTVPTSNENISSQLCSDVAGEREWFAQTYADEPPPTIDARSITGKSKTTRSSVGALNWI
jgi:hypothetical protein